MESACNREQFGCTQRGRFGCIHVLAIMNYTMRHFTIIHASIVSHACSVCAILCSCACAVWNVIKFMLPSTTYTLSSYFDFHKHNWILETTCR